MKLKKYIFIGIFILIVACLFFWKEYSNKDSAPGLVPAETDSTTQAVLTAEQLFAQKKPVLVELGAKWCPPCQQMKPILAALRADYTGIIIVDSVDVDFEKPKARALIERANINMSAIPVQLLFDANGSLLWQHVGYITDKDIRAVLARNSLVK